MITPKRFVLDTWAIINYFGKVFREPDRLSKSVRTAITQSLQISSSQNLFSVPAIVFVEIYEKWIRTEEMAAAFWHEVFTPIRRSNNFEIRSMDREILENLASIDGDFSEHELHDRLVVATAMALNATIVTADREIWKFARGRQDISGVTY